MRLIVNADDLGYSKGVNYGIYDAYKHGIVRSATLMMNMPCTSHAVNLFKNTDFSIGVHLNITAGQALLDHNYLTDEDGMFIKDRLFKQPIEALVEVENEYIAQIEKAYDLGIDVTHLDSHHHMHLNYVEIFKIVDRLSKKYSLPMRYDKNYKALQGLDVFTTDAFSSSFYNQTAQAGYFIQLLDTYSGLDTLEIMVHPGFLDGTLFGRDSYREMRMVEHSILTSDLLKAHIKHEGIELISYRDLLA